MRERERQRPRGESAINGDDEGCSPGDFNEPQKSPPPASLTVHRRERAVRGGRHPGLGRGGREQSRGREGLNELCDVLVQLGVFGSRTRCCEAVDCAVEKLSIEIQVAWRAVDVKIPRVPGTVIECCARSNRQLGGVGQGPGPKPCRGSRPPVSRRVRSAGMKLGTRAETMPGWGIRLEKSERDSRSSGEKTSAGGGVGGGG